MIDARRIGLVAGPLGFIITLLVAPPAFLGDLRTALGGAARQKLRGTLNKDLTHLPLAELAPHLAAIPRD